MNDLLPETVPGFLRDLPPVVLASLAGIFGLLLAATALTWLVGRLKPRWNLEEVWLRVRSWWTMALVFAVAMAVSRVVSLVFFTFLSFLALKEYLSLIPTRRADRRVLFWAYLAIPVQYLWIARDWYVMFLIFIPIYIFLFLPMRMVLIGETPGFLRAVGVNVIATLWGFAEATLFFIVPDHSVNGSASSGRCSTWRSMTAAPQASPHTLTAVRKRSRSQSTARIKPMPSRGSPTARSTITMVTRPAWGMPAAPMAARVAVMKIMNCWARVSSIPTAWAMKMAATDS